MERGVNVHDIDIKGGSGWGGGNFDICQNKIDTDV